MNRLNLLSGPIRWILILLLILAIPVHSQRSDLPKLTITPDEVVDDFSVSQPLGINLNYFEDNDDCLKAPRKISDGLKEMGVKFLRYPGGDKSDYYFFSRPPYEKSIPTLVQSGPGSNESRALFFNTDRTDYLKPPLNFDNFMTICKTVGAEPVLVCALDTYVMTPDRMLGSTEATKTSPRADYLRNAVAWVRYANAIHHYNVKYWVLGNETEVAYYKDSKGQYYGYTPEMYADDIVAFSKAMKEVDPSIKVIANGAAWLVKDYLPKAADSIDFIATSNYPLRKTPYSSYDDWVAQKYNHGDLVTAMEDILRVVDECPSISQEKKESLKIIATEFSSSTWWPNTWPSGQDLGHALFNFDIAGQTMSNPRFLFACFWNTRWQAHDNGSAFNALSDQNELLPLGQSLALWGNYLFPKMVKTSQVEGTVSYASYNENNHECYVDVINQERYSVGLQLCISGKTTKTITQVAELSGHDLKSDKTTFILHESKVIAGNTITLDPYSVSVFDIKF